jgi:hypothetical protein
LVRQAPALRGLERPTRQRLHGQGEREQHSHGWPRSEPIAARNINCHNKNGLLGRHNVLLRVATHPQRLIGQLTPKGWADTFSRQAVA